MVVPYDAGVSAEAVELLSRLLTEQETRLCTLDEAKVRLPLHDAVALRRLSASLHRLSAFSKPSSGRA